MTTKKREFYRNETKKAAQWERPETLGERG